MRLSFLLSISLLFLLTAHSVWAESSDAKTLLGTAFTARGELASTFTSELTAANTEFKKLPTALQTLFGNQRIHVELKLNDGSIEQLGVITHANTIQSATRYAPTNATLKVMMDEKTVTTIANARDKAGAFVQAVNQGKLKYQGLNSEAAFTTFVADMGVLLTNLVNAFAHLFGLN